jgi:hypothetical protein
MRLPSLSALLLAVALSAPHALSRQERERRHEPETELSAHMEKIEDAQKQLRRQLKDETGWSAALETLLEIQRQTLACKVLVPAQAAKVPEAERAAFVTAYQRTMVDFLVRQLELEAALLDRDANGVKSAFERLRAMEDSSHERFAPEEGD